MKSFLKKERFRLFKKHQEKWRAENIPAVSLKTCWKYAKRLTAKTVRSVKLAAIDYNEMQASANSMKVRKNIRELAMKDLTLYKLQKKQPRSVHSLGMRFIN